jgi:transcription elongation factor/antiterminator RfaH
MWNLFANTSPKLQANQRWFLVHTQPRSEARARMHLEAQGFTTFLPEISRTFRHARQLRTARSALFPRYLFIALDLDIDRWLSVRSTVGVSSLFTCDNRPVPVPDGIVEAFVERVGEANISLFGNNLQAGQKVRISSGPFADLIGTLDRLDDNGRVRVLLQMMGSTVSVGVHRAGLLPAA